MRDDWNIAEEGSGASVEPCRLRLICPKGLLSSSAWSGIRGRMEEDGMWDKSRQDTALLVNADLFSLLWEKLPQKGSHTHEPQTRSRAGGHAS